MTDRSRDWFMQAERDLRHARNALASEDYEWSCFASQQAAEKAAKALYLHHGTEGWGHSVKKLLDGLDGIEPSVPEHLTAAAMRLDRFYIPTRYPNGFPQGVPGEFFGRDDADRGIEDAERILAFVRRRLGL